MDMTTYLMYIAASAAVVIVPGPTVTLIIANSLRSGARAGLMNVAGTQAGLAVMLVVLAAGLSTIVDSMAGVFEIIRLLGAAYLIWLGIGLWRAGGSLGDLKADGLSSKRPRKYFWQGFLVIWSNPKALVFFGAFIPQFVDPGLPPLPQVILLGITFMVIATLLDGAYALLAGHGGELLSRRRICVLERLSGSCLIGGGLWLVLSRR